MHNVNDAYLRQEMKEFSEQAMCKVGSLFPRFTSEITRVIAIATREDSDDAERLAREVNLSNTEIFAVLGEFDLFSELRLREIEHQCGEDMYYNEFYA